MIISFKPVMLEVQAQQHIASIASTHPQVSEEGKKRGNRGSQDI